MNRFKSLLPIGLICILILLSGTLQAQDDKKSRKQKATEVADDDSAKEPKAEKKVKEKKPKIKLPKPFKVKRGIKTAKKAIKIGNYYVATDNLEKVLEAKPQKSKFAWTLATSYEATRDYRNAEKWYLFVMNSKDSTKYEMAPYQYAMMLKMNGKYEEAIKVLEKFKKDYKGDDKWKLKKVIDVDIEGCNLGISTRDIKVPVTVEHLSDKVNCAYSDIAPVLSEEGYLIFSSLQTDTLITHEGKKVDDIDNFVELWQSKKDGDEYGQAEKFPYFNKPGVHTSNGTFSPDNKRFFFTYCEQSSMASIRCDIYMSELKEGKWSEPEALEKVNAEGATSTHPVLTTDSRGNEVLYFTSNREGGKGGLDIWYSQISRSGRFGNPRNLGRNINTTKDEMTPFVNPYDRKFYFSSAGHPSIGGLDIFTAEGEKSRWKKIENLGPPVNSPADDMYPHFYYKNEKGYLVSNRKGIISLKHETCCDDIFYFEYDYSIKLAVKGFVYDEADSVELPMNDVFVTLMYATQDRAQDAGIAEVKTVMDEPYFFNINPDNNYRLVGIKPGYLTGSAEVNTSGITESDTIEVNIYMKRYEKEKAYRLSNIYYDFDKWDLKEESFTTLDSLYNIMVENKNITIELSSHTDSRGNDDYNQELSQKRAESCVNYLISKGVDEERITPVGYGETQLLDKCNLYPECGDSGDQDCPCHQKNRRTEFKITGELDGDLEYGDEYMYEDDFIDEEE